MKKKLYHFLKKIGILKLAIKIASIVYKNNKPTNISLESAYSILNEFSPDPKTFAFRETRQSIKYDWDLDIIVPCYNAEKTLRKCIYSCLNQKTNYSYRVIAIDDGSLDTTAQILEEYVKYPNFLMIKQKNKGHSGARNSGLDVCCSKYVMFVDSDDYIDSSAVENLMSVAIQNDASIVEGGYSLTNKNGKILKNIPCKSIGLVNPVQRGILKGQPWGKVIKSSIFQNIQFPENYLYEDTIDRVIIYDLIAQSNQKVYCISNCVYYYLSNPENISHTSVYKPKCLDTLYITLSLFYERSKFGLKMDQYYYEYILRQICLNFRRTRFVPLNIQQAIFVATREFFIKNFKGFHTQTKDYYYLEKAIIEDNFKLYKIVCSYTLD